MYEKLGEIQVTKNGLSVPYDVARYVVLVRFGKIPKKKRVRKKKLKVAINEALERALRESSK